MLMRGRVNLSGFDGIWGGSQLSSIVIVVVLILSWLASFSW